MVLNRWIRGLAATGLGLALTSPALQAQQPGQPGQQGQPRQAGQAGQANQGGRQTEGQNAADVPTPIGSLEDLQDFGRMLFASADTNKDGQISQKEAVDAGNLLVGGFFFRADANGDGTLSREEAQEARDSLLRQQPVLRYLLQQAKSGEGRQEGSDQNPFQVVGSLLDANNDQQLQATEVRQAVQTAVQGLYAAADTNRDGQMSPEEVNAAIIGLGRAAAQAAFRAADADNNGTLSKEEFQQAIVEPANAVFGVLDLDNDGQISPQELQRARRVMTSQIQLFPPEADNSARNLLNSGRNPGSVSPIPDFGGGAPGGQQGQSGDRQGQPGAGQPGQQPNPSNARPGQPGQQPGR